MSYFPCDEGLYKKKYLNPEDCGIVAGMEMVIDDTIENYIANNEIDERDIDKILFESLHKEDEDLFNEKFEEALEQFCEDGLVSDEEFANRKITLTLHELTRVLDSFRKYIADDIASWIEMDRGETLVAFIDKKYEDYTEEQMKPLWEQSSKDEYTDKDPETDSNYTYNSNRKPRPIWRKDNTWNSQQ